MKRWKLLSLSILTGALMFGAFQQTTQTAIATESVAGTTVASQEDMQVESYTALKNGESVSGKLTAGGVDTYEFTAPSAGTYSFFTTGDLDTQGTLYKGEGKSASNFLAYEDDNGTGDNFRINYDLNAGQKVLLEVCGYDNTVVGSYSVSVCKNYTISFNSNGGSGSIYTMTKLHGTNIILPDSRIAGTNTYTVTFLPNGGACSTVSKKVPRMFRCWNLSKAGDGIGYNSGASFYRNEDTTLYAVWGNATMSTLPTPTRNGYEFLGWYTELEGGTRILANSPINGNKFLYAHWERIVKNLTLDQVYEDTVADWNENCYRFKAPADGIYRFETLQRADGADTYADLYNDDSFTKTIDSNDDGGDGKNFSVQKKMKAGETVGLSVGRHATPNYSSYSLIVRKIHSVDYNSNGGSGSLKTDYVYHGNEYQIPTSALRKDIHITLSHNNGTGTVTGITSSSQFLGKWNSRSDGTGTVYQEGGKYVINTNLILYAMYSKVTFGQFTITSPTRAGYEFDGWYTDSTGGTRVTSTTVINSDVTYYAHWRSPLAITTQPKSVSVASGEKATFTVKATGTGLSYQWKYSMDNGATWKASTATSAKTASFSITAAEKWNGMRVFCKVTDANGQELKTSVAKLTVTTPLVITTQPTDVTAEVGKKAAFTVKATGTGLSYQWKYSMDNGATWKVPTSDSAKTATFSITAAEKWGGMKLFCRITDANGQSVTTKVVRLNVKPTEVPGPQIIAQPESCTVAVGVKAEFSIVTRGDGISYQWYYSTDNGATWKVSTASTAKSATFGITAAEKWNGMLLRCVVSDQNGGKVTSNTATLKVTSTVAKDVEIEVVEDGIY